MYNIYICRLRDYEALSPTSARVSTRCIGWDLILDEVSSNLPRFVHRDQEPRAHAPLHKLPQRRVSFPRRTRAGLHREDDDVPRRCHERVPSWRNFSTSSSSRATKPDLHGRSGRSRGDGRRREAHRPRTRSRAIERRHMGRCRRPIPQVRFERGKVLSRTATSTTSGKARLGVTAIEDPVRRRSAFRGDILRRPEKDSVRRTAVIVRQSWRPRSPPHELHAATTSATSRPSEDRAREALRTTSVTIQARVGDARRQFTSKKREQQLAELDDRLLFHGGRAGPRKARQIEVAWRSGTKDRSPFSSVLGSLLAESSEQSSFGNKSRPRVSARRVSNFLVLAPADLPFASRRDGPTRSGCDAT